MTYGAGLALANQFHLSAIGRRRMEEAMLNLRGIPGLDKVLWFGFGHQSVVRELGSNIQGLKLVALCSCLTEVHSEENAARVMEELWELSGYPENYEPSHSQFLTVIKACSGVISRCNFNETLDAMTGNGRWMFGRDRVYNPVLKASNARDIAKAMRGIFQITKGDVDAVTLIGQNECAFIAAFAYWLLDLAVYVEEAGHVIFKSREDMTPERAQVLVLYTSENQQSAIQHRTTFVLPVGTDLVSRFVSTSESRWILKISWNGCLLRTFGPDFEKLSSLVRILGLFLGATARIYTALATGEPNVAGYCRTRFIGFSQFSHGQGFVQSVTTIFQELERVPKLNDTMERGLHISFDKALREIEQTAQSLKAICHCDICGNAPSSDSDSSSTCGAKGETCLLALAMTIRYLVTLLACANWDEGLPVAVHGLQSSYALNLSIYSRWAEEKGNKQNLVDIAVGLATIKDPPHILVPTPETLLRDIRPLFDGSIPLSSSPADEIQTATASSGICCFRECLQGISTEAARMRTLHIIPGHIERGPSQYAVVSDGGFDHRLPPLSESITLPKVTCIQTEDINLLEEPINLNNFEIKSLARESSKYREISFFYKVLLPDGSILQIQPG